MGKKPIVSVIYENERISILKMCVTSLLCGPQADLWPFYGFFRDVTHILSKVSCFLLKFFHFRRLQKR